MRTALTVFAVFFAGCGPVSTAPSDAPIPLSFYEAAPECEATCRTDGMIDCTASPGCADAIVACVDLGAPPDFMSDTLACEAGSPVCGEAMDLFVVCYRPRGDR